MLRLEKLPAESVALKVARYLPGRRAFPRRRPEKNLEFFPSLPGAVNEPFLTTRVHRGRCRLLRVAFRQRPPTLRPRCSLAMATFTFEASERRYRNVVPRLTRRASDELPPTGANTRAVAVTGPSNLGLTMSEPPLGVFS